jgi:hypothetical protein
VVPTWDGDGAVVPTWDGDGAGAVVPTSDGEEAGAVGPGFVALADGIGNGGADDIGT